MRLQSMQLCLNKFGPHAILQRTYLCCSVYNERQLLNQKILAAMTNNAVHMEPTDTLWQKQDYITPHSRANIVHPERHQQPATQPMARSAQIKVEDSDTDMIGPTEDLSVLIHKLEQNLQRELVHISEQDFVTVMKLLKPVQVGTKDACCLCLCFLSTRQAYALHNFQSDDDLIAIDPDLCINVFKPDCLR